MTNCHTCKRDITGEPTEDGMNCQWCYKEDME